MPTQSLAAAALLASVAIHGNRVELQLNQGAAEIAWVTDSTFRLRHALAGTLPADVTPQKQAVAVRAMETPGAYTISSKLLDVTLHKHGLLVEVRHRDGAVLMRDLSEARPRADGGVAWERAAHPSDRFFGLGPRADSTFDLRGKVVRRAMGMLISSSGYGERHNAAGAYTFDIAHAQPGRYRIEAPAVDYYFLYGPSPKEVFEESAALRNAVIPAAIGSAATGTWDTLREAVLRVVHASMSGIPMPEFDLTPWMNAPPELAQRAQQFAQICAGLVPADAAPTGLRRQLATFFATYGEEARDRGFPYFHPLPFQFPADPAALDRVDQFMLGDEMLVAPIVTPSNRREVYLPRGVWTNLETNEVFPGRRTVTVESKELPVFARNGTIVPLDALQSGDPMLLHYFPSLGAEFFLLETQLADWSQVHAAPAADIVRLEIESKVDRRYEWVVRHVKKPGRVEFEAKRYREMPSHAALQDGTWFYDARTRNLHVRVWAAAGEDVITNIVTPEL
jgi:alpha-glucosidase (family GH31 glycosyl hydrolase)